MREGRQGPAEPEWIPFFCECERADCYQPVWLTSDQRGFRRVPLVLPGHEAAP
jgi:hypothetical protein